MRQLAAASVAVSAVLFAPSALAGDPQISLSYLASTPRVGFDVAGAEIVAFDAASKRAFVVNGFANAGPPPSPDAVWVPRATDRSHLSDDWRKNVGHGSSPPVINAAGQGGEI